MKRITNLEAYQKVRKKMPKPTNIERNRQKYNRKIKHKARETGDG